MARRVERKPKKEKRWTPAEGREALLAWRQSGLTLADFCRQRGIGEHRLTWWRRRLANEADSAKGSGPDARRGGLVEAVISGVRSEQLERSSAVVLQLRSGDRIEVGSPERVDASWLLSLCYGLDRGVGQ